MVALNAPAVSGLFTLRNAALLIFGAIATYIAAQLSSGWIETLGVLTGGLAVYFLAHNFRNTGWIFGVVNTVFFMLLFASAKLYADFALNAFYLLTCLGGLYIWNFGRKERGERKPVPITNIDKKWLAGLMLIGLLGSWLMGATLTGWTDADLPYIDSFTTVFSMVAQYMLMRKWFENWYLWIFVDIIDIGLYAYKGLWLVVGLTAVYMVLCVIGLIEWRKDSEALSFKARVAELVAA